MRSLPGASKDQYDAASMTPAANPSMPSRNLRLNESLEEHSRSTTVADPSAVRNHVKSVPRKAWVTGWYPIIILRGRVRGSRTSSVAWPRGGDEAEMDGVYGVRASCTTLTELTTNKEHDTDGGQQWCPKGL